MITVRHMSQGQGMIVFVDGDKSVAEFKTLVQRGAGTWTDATAEIKEAADMITSGVVMQNYEEMSGERKS